MNALISLLMSFSFILVGDPGPVLDIPYYQNNPEIRAETLRRCHKDHALARTPACENAEAAGTLSLGRPLSSWPEEALPLLTPPKPKKRQAPPPASVRPRGVERAA
jgi:hypothetical protein